MESFEKAYTTKEVSSNLEIGASTLRKWCLSLEGNGYHFSRTEGNKRLFVEGDLIALRYFKRLVQDENFSLDNASKVVTSKYTGEASETRTPPVPNENKEDNTPAILDQRSLMSSDDVKNRLLDFIIEQELNMKQLKQEISSLREEIKLRDKYMSERFEERDRNLMESLNKSLEERKKQHEKEVAAAREEERKKGFFTRLFGK